MMVFILGKKAKELIVWSDMFGEQRYQMRSIDENRIASNLNRNEGLREMRR